MSFMGVARRLAPSSSIRSRIDIWCISHVDIATALVSLTGNTINNRYLHKYAYSLNAPVFSHSESISACDVELRCELDFFSYFGLAYIRPNERTCFAIGTGLGGIPHPDDAAAEAAEAAAAGAGRVEAPRRG